MSGKWYLIPGVMLGLINAGCATTAPTQVVPPTQAVPTLQGSYHTVRRGETLWRIAHAYGVSVESLAHANRIPDSTQLDVGQRLFIPLPQETQRFLWPLHGPGRSGDGLRGVDIAAPAGSLVRASRSGRVAVAAQRLSGWGKIVMVDHLDGYSTIYAGLERVLVTPGSYLRQGTPVGSTGSGALYFEIRHGATPRDTLALLP